MAGIPLNSQFTFNAALALDERFVFADTAARDALASGRRYAGLLTYVEDVEKFYYLKGGITDSDWTELAGGGGGSGILSVADTTERNAIDSGDRYEGLIVYVVDIATNYQLQGGITNSDWIAVDKSFIGLGNVDNTSDLDKPISTDTQDALDLKADLTDITPTIFGTRAVPRSIVAGTGITAGASHMSTTAVSQTIFLKGSSSGENDISANPQIEAGTLVGQLMTLIGRNSDDYIKLDHGNGVDLSGGSSWFSFVGCCLVLEWDGTNWYEKTRRG